MFTNLSLRNFQCHQKLDIPLSKITTIVGSSDSGKSACVRALNWICFNNLRGDAFITHGQDQCAVSVEVDGRTISRIKTKTKNIYQLENAEYSAVGSDVPPDIAKILNMGETNMANQHDPIFWFSLTPGQLAKELNAIADIAWVDRVLQISVSDLRKNNTEIDVITSRVVNLEAAVKETEWVVSAEEQLTAVIALHETYQECKNAYDRMTELSERLFMLRQQMAQIQRLLDDFAAVRDKYEHLQRQKASLDRLSTLISKYPSELPDISYLLKRYEIADTLQRKYHRLSQLLSSLPKSAPNTDEISRLQDRLQKTYGATVILLRLEELIKKYKEHSAEVQSLTNIVDSLESDLREQTQGVCPICQRPLP